MRLHYYQAIIMDSDEGQIKSSYLVPFGSFHVHNVCNLSDVVVRCKGIDVVINQPPSFLRPEVYRRPNASAEDFENCKLIYMQHSIH